MVRVEERAHRAVKVEVVGEPRVHADHVERAVAPSRGAVAHGHVDVLPCELVGDDVSESVVQLEVLHDNGWEGQATSPLMGSKEAQDGHLAGMLIVRHVHVHVLEHTASLLPSPISEVDKKDRSVLRSQMPMRCRVKALWTPPRERFGLGSSYELFPSVWLGPNACAFQPVGSGGLEGSCCHMRWFGVA